MSVKNKQKNVSIPIRKLAADVKGRLPTMDGKRLVMLNIPYVIVFYLADKVAWLYRHCMGDSLVAKVGVLFLNFQLAFENFMPSFHIYDLIAGMIGAVAVKTAVYLKGKNAKKYRQGEEYGSARWGNEKDIAPFIDPVFENNILLTQTERLTMNSRPKLPKYARNKNVIVIGGSGSGKTRFYVKPNLMQMTPNVSYVVTDPKGTILVECGKMLKRGSPKIKDGKIVRDKNGKIVYEPYKIKVLNTINFKKSMHYNPFRYIRSEKDILKLVNTIIANTKGEGEKSSEDFWVKAERLLYCALIGYIYYEAPEEEQNFSTLLEFINASEAREDDEEFKNAVDELFEELEKEKPEHFAVRQYKKYKLAAGVISLKRLLNHQFLRNWSSKMIKKSLEAYFLPKTQNCTFLKTFSKDGNILPRQSGYSVRNFSNRHKIQRNLKKLRYYLVKQRPKDGLSERNFFEDPYTNLDNGAACP